MENKLLEFSHIFAGETLPDKIYPFSFLLIQTEQKYDDALINHAKEKSTYSINFFMEWKVTPAYVQRWKNSHSTFATTSHSKLVSYDVMSPRY